MLTEETACEQSSELMMNSHPGTATLLWRALRLRCPKCGGAAIFLGWFAMNDRCPACGRLFNRSPGYFLGSIYFNYGLTAVLVVIAYFSFYFSHLMSGTPLLVLLTAFIVVFPLWFFRYARSLWLALDEFLDPWPNEEERRRGEQVDGPQADGGAAKV
jgi:uncharacterized protein (DUF983 family)